MRRSNTFPSSMRRDCRFRQPCKPRGKRPPRFFYRISRSLTSGGRNHGFRIGQIGSASMVSLAHGTNDAQKTMGVITLALIANGTLPANATAPFWVIVSCAIAISLGTYVGGWRVIRTLGKGLV